MKVFYIYIYVIWRGSHWPLRGDRYLILSKFMWEKLEKLWWDVYEYIYEGVGWASRTNESVNRCQPIQRKPGLLKANIIIISYSTNQLFTNVERTINNRFIWWNVNGIIMSIESIFVHKRYNHMTLDMPFMNVYKYKYSNTGFRFGLFTPFNNIRI